MGFEKIYDTAIFDFDGTLFDTSEGIIANLKRTLKELGCAPLPQQTLRKFIGPSLLVSFKKYCGMDDKKALEAIYVYRREYDSEGYKRSKMYDGMPALLLDLRAAGVKTVVASAKPQYILDPTVDYFGARKYFDKVVGSAEEGRPDNDKKSIVARAMTPGRCVMIGDSPYDIDGGRDNGVDTIAVLYGFGFDSRSHALLSRPDFIAATVDELRALLLKNRDADN